MVIMYHRLTSLSENTMGMILKTKFLKVGFKIIVLEHNSTVDTKFDRLSKVQSTPLYYDSVGFRIYGSYNEFYRIKDYYKSISHNIRSTQI